LRTPGIVIVTCKDATEAESIMKIKKKLLATRLYSKVYIDFDKPKEARIMEANMRVLAKSVGNNDLFVRGGRLLSRSHNTVNHNNTGASYAKVTGSNSRSDLHRSPHRHRYHSPTPRKNGTKRPHSPHMNDDYQDKNRKHRRHEGRDKQNMTDKDILDREEPNHRN
jgi:hypothetical protein